MLLLQDFLIFFMLLLRHFCYFIYGVVKLCQCCSVFSLLNAQDGPICFNIKGMEKVYFPDIKSIMEFRLLQLSGFYASKFDKLDPGWLFYFQRKNKIICF